MKLIVFASCVIFALAVVIISGTDGLYCYKSVAFSRVEIVNCTGGACSIIGFKSMQTASCTSRHKTGSYVIGEYTYYYCDRNLCNRFWYDAESSDVDAIVNEEEPTNKGFPDHEAFGGEFLTKGIPDLDNEALESEHNSNKVGGNKVPDNERLDNGDPEDEILNTLFGVNGYQRLKEEIFYNSRKSTKL